MIFKLNLEDKLNTIFNYCVFLWKKIKFNFKKIKYKIKIFNKTNYLYSYLYKNVISIIIIISIIISKFNYV